MFKNVSSGFSKVLARKELLIAIVALLIGVALLSYSGSKTYSLDGLDVMQENVPLAKTQPTVNDTHAQYAPTAEVSNGESRYALSSTATASDLLPNDPNGEWSNIHGLSTGATPDLLSPGQYIGISSAALRNANLQLRSDPPITKLDIGPWNQSTMEGDISRVPLEIGYSGGCVN